MMNLEVVGFRKSAVAFAVSCAFWGASGGALAMQLGSGTDFARSLQDAAAKLKHADVPLHAQPGDENDQSLAAQLRRAAQARRNAKVMPSTQPSVVQLPVFALSQQQQKLLEQRAQAQRVPDSDASDEDEWGPTPAQIQENEKNAAQAKEHWAQQQLLKRQAPREQVQPQARKELVAQPAVKVEKSEPVDLVLAMANRRATMMGEQKPLEKSNEQPLQSPQDRQKAQPALANLFKGVSSRDIAKPPAAPPVTAEVQEGPLAALQPGTLLAAPELQMQQSAARPRVIRQSSASDVSGLPADAAMPAQALPMPWPSPPHAAAVPQDLMPSALALAADADGAPVAAAAAAPAVAAAPAAAAKPAPTTAPTPAPTPAAAAAPTIDPAPSPKPASAVQPVVAQPQVTLPELPPMPAALPQLPAVTAVVAAAAESSVPALAAKRKRPADLTIDTDRRYEFDGKMGRAPKLIKRGVGTLVLNHAGEMRNGVHLKQGRIELGHELGLGQGRLLMDDGSAIDLALDGMVVANDLHMTGSDDPEINTGGNHQTWAGAISGAGFLTKQGTGSLTLTNAANSYTGATEVAQGSLQAGAAHTFSAASVHSIAADAALNLAGFDQTIAALNNAGAVQLSAPSGTPGTVLTVTGPYVGQGGELAIATNGHASDRLLLSGAAAVASGNTNVRIANVGALGEKTADGGIEIIATENGARLEPEAFALEGGHVDAGAYAYRLHQTAQGARLQSSYRAEVPLISALPAQLRQADMGMLGDMHQRLGDAPGGAGNDRRAWGRMLRTDPGIRQQGSVNPQSSGHLTGFQTGLDLYADKNVHAGFYLGQLRGDTGVKGLAGGSADKYVGFNRLQGRYLGLYASWLGEKGLYADTVLQWADYRNHLHTQESHAATKGRSRLASLEIGQPFGIDSRWQIEPQAQLVYRQISLDDTALSQATVQHKTPSDWTLRLGARLKGSFTTSAGVLQPYGSVNIYRSSNTSDVARFVVPAATTDIHTQGGHTSTALAAGATLQLNPRTSFYGELSRHRANGGQSRVKSGVQATAGVKLRW